MTEDLFGDRSPRLPEFPAEPHQGAAPNLPSETPSPCVIESSIGPITSMWIARIAIAIRFSGSDDSLPRP